MNLPKGKGPRACFSPAALLLLALLPLAAVSSMFAGPSLTSATTFVAGAGYTATASGGNGIGGYYWIMTGSTVPGASINQTSGVISGASSAGTITLKVMHQTSVASFGLSPTGSSGEGPYTQHLNFDSISGLPSNEPASASGTPYNAGAPVTCLVNAGGTCVVAQSATGSGSPSGSLSYPFAGPASFSGSWTGFVFNIAYAGIYGVDNPAISGEYYGGFIDSASYTITVTYNPISSVTITGPSTYTGSALTPTYTTTPSGGTVAFSPAIETNAGTYSPSWAATGIYSGNGSASWTIAQASQTITATPSPASITTIQTSTVTASGGGGTGAITYSIQSGPGSVNSSTGAVTPTGTGTVVVLATKAADANYLAATATATITVSLTAQTITFANPSSQAVGASVPLNATTTSGLTLSYAVTGPLSVIGSNANVTGAGTGQITVTQGGNSTYAAAAPVVVTFSCIQTPAITSASSTSHPVGSAFSFTVTATGSPAPTFSATGLPSWATLNSATGAITGTPTLLSQVGSSTVTLTASNGFTGSQSFTLTISNVSGTLTTAAGAGGTVSAGGTYAWGATTGTITATPSAGYRFGSWSLTGNGTVNSPGSATTTVTAGSASATLTANFVPQFVLTTAAGPGGSVSSGGTYDSGSVVPVTATPSAGYRFGSWTTTGSAAASPSSASTTVTLGTATTLTANFVQQFAVAVTGGAGGTVTGSGTYDINSVVTVTAMPSAGYRFGAWGGAQVGMLVNPAIASTTLTATQNAAVSATFVAQGTLTVTASPVAGGSVIGAGTYDNGTVATIAATPYAGYIFTGWTGGTVANSNGATTTATVAGNSTVTANFFATSPVSSGTIIFPNASASGISGLTPTTSTRTAMIANGGTSPLTVSSLTGTGDFAPTVTLPLVIGAGTTAPITVTFSPSAVGARIGVFTALANDSAQTVIQFALQGNGMNPNAAPVLGLGVNSQGGHLINFPGDTLVLSANATVGSGTVTSITWSVTAPDNSVIALPTINGPATPLTGSFPSFVPAQIGTYTLNATALAIGGQSTPAASTFVVVQGLYNQTVNAVAVPVGGLSLWFTNSSQSSSPPIPVTKTRSP